MPEYVYALHDFLPENEDEVSFRAGDRIEVIERDDMYGDGWWQGRNLAGKIGLFPQSYTAPGPSAGPPVSAPSDSTEGEPSVLQSSSTFLQPLSEEPESEITDKSRTSNTGSVNGHTAQLSSDGEVMKATMTDVQKAIEQLGRNDRDGSRSFSFASSRDGDLTDRETETDHSDHDLDGEDWHRDARTKLAEQSRKVVEAARELEEMEQVRTVVPPIEVEMSDESEGEEDEEGRHHHGHSFSRRHPHIPEEDEGEPEDIHERAGDLEKSKEDEVEEPSANFSSEDLQIPEQDESDLATATARHTSFPAMPPSEAPEAPSTPALAQRDSMTNSLPTPTSPGSPLPPDSNPITDYVVPYPVVASSVEKLSSQTTPNIANAAIALPSPAASSVGQHPRDASKHNSVASSAKASAASEPAPSPGAQSPQKPTHPSEWTVDEVVEWLKSKGFDQDVCDKFIEQEITGDVLLELDVNLLKSEIGIVAFGKRMRIANAITDLRRPPSIIYSDNQGTLQSPTQSHAQTQPYSYTHSHSHSLQSSTQQSLNSPAGYGAAGFASMMSPESPPHTGDIVGTPFVVNDARRVSDPGSSANLSLNVTDVDDGTNGISGGLEKAAMVGLGLGVPGALLPANGRASKNRPTQLQLSPSDSALGAKAIRGEIPEEADEERAALSENETAPSTKQRRGMFSRSSGSQTSTKVEKRDSATSKGSRGSKEVTTPLSAEALLASEGGRVPRPSAEGSVSSRHSRGKRSVDGAKTSDRLSIFGGTLAIGKSRKPPPRYSSYVDSDTPSEKSSHMNLARLYGGTSGRKASGRPSTPDKQKVVDSKEKEKVKEKEVKDARDPALLRKRTSSSPNGELPTRAMVPSALKPGQSIIEQIGDPDHNGWMRKKGERYNSWKLRYFVLKGPHLYYLRSNSKSETKIKGYINILGYKVIADENANPGRYGFRIVHDTDKTHFFSSEEQLVVREWMKAIMKSTIGRDYTKPVVSSCNIPTIPLTVAQAMNPAPRPPSPTQRAATQKSFRRENPNQLSSRDARILMGLPSPEAAAGEEDKERTRLDSFFANEPVSSQGTSTPMTPVPPRPTREARRISSTPATTPGAAIGQDASLIEWANSHLPSNLQITDPTGSLCGGLTLLRLAESIKGRASSPPVPNSAFPSGPNDDKLDGLFRLFDFLLDNDVKMGSVSINDVRQGKREKIVQLLKALKAWEDKRKAIVNSIGQGSAQGGAFVAPVGKSWGSL